MIGCFVFPYLSCMYYIGDVNAGKAHHIAKLNSDTALTHDPVQLVSTDDKFLTSIDSSTNLENNSSLADVQEFNVQPSLICQPLVNSTLTIAHLHLTSIQIVAVYGDLRSSSMQRFRCRHHLSTLSVPSSCQRPHHLSPYLQGCQRKS